MSILTDKLIQVSKKHQQTDPSVDEFDMYPYIPYIPNNWNGILLLGEAQQLSKNNERNRKYIEQLEKLDPLNQMMRLANKALFSDGQIGISPWDEGYLQMAMAACFPELLLKQYALSNAIPWHLNKTNKEQTEKYVEMARQYWYETLCVLIENGLRVVIRTGEFARDILNWNYLTKHCNLNDVFYLRSASQLERVAYLFDKVDLLTRYPEIQMAIEKTEAKWQSLNHIFYASHALSRIKAN